MSPAEYRKQLLDKMKQDGFKKYDAELLTPEQINAMKLGNTSFEQIKEDEGALAAQQESMNRYKEIADNGGYSAADQSATLRGQKQANQQDAARKKAILSEMQQRGQAGSGAELAAKLSSADSAAERNSEDSMEIAARGEQRRDAAVAAKGNLGGQMRDQSYRRQSDLAGQRDGVSRFNADLTSRAAFTNNGTRNQTGMYNNRGENDLNQRSFEYDYNGSVDDENRRIAEQERKRKAKKGQMGAILGTAGAVVAGAYTGGAGAGAGYAAGNAIGQSFSSGGKVEGPEMVPGDHPGNDIAVSALSPGEVVLPKSIAKDPAAAAEFVAEEQGEEIELEDALKMIALAISNLDKKKGK